MGTGATTSANSAVAVQYEPTLPTVNQVLFVGLSRGTVSDLSQVPLSISRGSFHNLMELVLVSNFSSFDWTKSMTADCMDSNSSAKRFSKTGLLGGRLPTLDSLVS